MANRRIFTSNGTYTPTPGTTSCDVLIVGGGGSGGRSSASAGGGGAGGVIFLEKVGITEAIQVSIGSGGTPVSESNPGNNGGNTVFGSHTAIGGGAGGGSREDGVSGGSGGGGGGLRSSGTDTVGGSGTEGQGHAGGAGFRKASASEIGGGGGGGAGGPGADAVEGFAGDAGDGADYSAIFGTDVGASGWFAGGGGGGSETSGNPGTGGTGGGGAGGNDGEGGTDGLNGTGSGGGGSGGGGTSGAGGDGIVIVMEYDDQDPIDDGDDDGNGDGGTGQGSVHNWTGGSETAGSVTSSFTNGWESSIDYWQVQDDPEAEADGKSLVLTGGSGRRFIRLDDAPRNLDPATDRIDTRFRYYTDLSGGDFHMPRLFASMTEETAIFMDGDNGTIRIGEYVNGSFDDVSSSTSFPLGERWYRGRVLWEPSHAGARFKIKLWNDDEQEPSAWALESDPPTEPQVGDVGIGINSGDSGKLDWISFGVQGADAEDLQDDGGSGTPEPTTTEFAIAWLGAVSQDSFTVSAQPSETGTVTLTVSSDSSFNNTVATTSANGTQLAPAKLTVNGLSPDTQYYWKIERGDVEYTEGVCKTFPVAEQPANFSAVLGSCAGHYRGAYDQNDTLTSNAPTFDRIRERNPDVFVHLGDIHYKDISSNSPSAFREGFRHVFDNQRQYNLYTHVPTAYIWDDHDYGPDNSDYHDSGRPAALSVYRDFVPHYELPDGPADDTPIYQAFTLGRVRFIMLDNRSERDAVSNSILGTAQKQWLFGELESLAAKPDMALVLCAIVPWIGGDSDSWGEYPSERAEISQAIEDNDLTHRTIIVAGDMHNLGIDDGSNNTYADEWDGSSVKGPAVFQVGGLDAGRSEKGGPYSEGLVGTFNGTGPTSGAVQNYGLLDVQDDGGSTITINMRGMSLEADGTESEKISYSVAIDTTKGYPIEAYVGPVDSNSILYGQGFEEGTYIDNPPAPTLVGDSSVSMRFKAPYTSWADAPLEKDASVYLEADQDGEYTSTHSVMYPDGTTDTWEVTISVGSIPRFSINARADSRGAVLQTPMSINYAVLDKDTLEVVTGGEKVIDASSFEIADGALEPEKEYILSMWSDGDMAVTVKAKTEQ